MKINKKRILILGLLLLFLMPCPQINAQDLDEDFKIWTMKRKNFAGLNFSVAHEEGTNVQRLLVQDQEMYTLDWAVRFYGGHFINDYITLGAVFEWKQSKGDRKFLSDGETIQEDFISSGFLIGPSLRTYLPVSKTGRVSIFNDVNLLFGYSNGVNQKDNAQEIERAVSKSYSFKLGLTPGLNFFVSKGWAFEASVDLLGLETRVDESTKGGVESRRVSNNVNFSVNLLALKLGVTKYF